MTCFVLDLEPPLLRQLKSRKGIFCLPFWLSIFLEWKDFMRLPPLFQPTTWGSDLEPLDCTLSCCCLRREYSWSFNFWIPLWSFAFDQAMMPTDYTNVRVDSCDTGRAERWQVRDYFKFHVIRFGGQLQLYSCAPLVLFDIFKIIKVRVQVPGDCWRRDQACKFWPLPRWGRKQW